jgi:hypothetical protein
MTFDTKEAMHKNMDNSYGRGTATTILVQVIVYSLLSQQATC